MRGFNKLCPIFLLAMLSESSLQSELILREIAWASSNPDMKFIWVKHKDWNMTYPNKNLRDFEPAALWLCLDFRISFR